MQCSVQDCQSGAKTRGWCVKHYTRWTRTGSPHIVRKIGSEPRPIQERFWEKVDIKTPEECWPWKAALQKGERGGYGIFKVGGKVRKAHRLAYEFSKGPLPEGYMPLHTCDRRECCNPNHLYAGTHSDNARDAVLRGRMYIASGDQHWTREDSERGKAFRERMTQRKGDSHPSSKIPDAAVSRIRERYAEGGILQRELAQEYGISKAQVGRIIRHQRRK